MIVHRWSSLPIRSPRCAPSAHGNTAALIIAALTLLTGAFAAQAQQGKNGTAEKSAKASPSPNGAGAPVKQSDAERITSLQRTIDENTKRLHEMRSKIDDPQSDYAKAEAEFKTLDQELEEKKKQVESLRQKGAAPDQLEPAVKELDALQQRWTLAKERFDLTIQERRALLDQAKTLEQKIQQDRDALNKLVNPDAAKAATTPAAAAEKPQEAPAGGANGAGQTTTPGQTEQAPADKPSPPAAMPPGVPAAEQKAAGNGGQAAQPAKPPSEEVVKAQEKVQAAQSEAEEAEQEVRTVTERIDKVEQAITNERKLLVNARQRADNARKTVATLTQQVQQKSSEGAPREEVQAMWAQINDAQTRLQEARDEVASRVDAIDKLQSEKSSLQAEHIDALQEAEQKRQVADEAQKELEEIQNPFSVPNVVQWFLDHGPRIVGIVVGMMILLWVASRVDNRIIDVIAGRSDRGSWEERENRAKTLVAVFHNAARVVVIAGGLLMVLAEVNIDIVPLMGGVAVVGLAVAFGAQNLIRDFFYGFMILLENQYGINDVIKIGDHAGLVERVTLRLTILRDLEGTVHFIPNGEIKAVRNMTHGWSRALFDIGVAYKEDVDKVIEVLKELGTELRDDPKLGPVILDNPEMLGVDSFGDSAVTIKFFIKTRPLQQWTVKREMLRRIKKRFDELGIEIPFPHRTVFHHHSNGPLPHLEAPTDAQAQSQAFHGAH